MFYLSRRQVHATLAGAAAAGLYLAAAELGSKKPVRVGGLLTLATLSMAGVLGNRGSVKAYSAHKRIDNLVPQVATALTAANGAAASVNGKYDKTGGTISGTVTVTGDHIVQGITHTHLTAPSGFANVQITGSGLGVIGGNIDANHNSVVNAAQVTGGGSPVSLPDGTSHGGSLVMNNNNGFTFGHITSNQIGPGTTRANLGGTATLAQLTARSDYHNGVLQGANICY